MQASDYSFNASSSQEYGPRLLARSNIATMQNSELDFISAFQTNSGLLDRYTNAYGQIKDENKAKKRFRGTQSKYMENYLNSLARRPLDEKESEVADVSR